MKLSSTARRVLTNLATGKPMWEGTLELNPGSGIPSVRTSLLRKGLITWQDTLTPRGRTLAKTLME